MFETTTQYGNPTAEMMQWVSKNTFLDHLFSVCSEYKFPPSNSDAVKSELQQIKTLVDELPKHEELKKRYHLYDRSLIQYVSGFKFPDDPDTQEIYKDLVQQVFDDVSPLVYKLKLHHQRPRPFQLAFLHKVELYPYASFSAQSPAFPCLHTTIGAVLAHVIGNRIPSTYKYFKDLSDDIYHSRLYMGLCLVSDVDGGRKVAQAIISESEFKIKYGM